MLGLGLSIAKGHRRSGSSPPPPSSPGIPQNLLATPGNTVAHLAWDAVAGATGYNIYQDGVFAASQSGAPGNTIGTLTNGVEYSFTVSATNGAGESAQSDPATVTPTAFVYLRPDGSAYLRPDGTSIYIRP